MKITSKILSIPPYLSTTWKNVASLSVRPEGGLFTLIVGLQDMTRIEIPALNQEMVDEIFEAHARSNEVEGQSPLDSPFSLSVPMLSDGGGLAPLPFQHNPEQADLPPLQPSILKKIGAIIRALGGEEIALNAAAEKDCNCMYCQMARAIRGEEEPKEEEIAPEDLRFRDWEIAQTGDQLYSVTNPLDANEHYSVFLGSPVGCTCGSKNCEHIRAVLNS